MLVEFLSEIFGYCNQVIWTQAFGRSGEENKAEIDLLRLRLLLEDSEATIETLQMPLLQMRVKRIKNITVFIFSKTKSLKPGCQMEKFCLSHITFKQ